MKLPEKNWLEWTVFALSLALVLSVLGVLTYDALTSGRRPPQLSVALGEPTQHGSHYSVPLTIFNEGDETAERVQIRVSLVKRGQVQESSELTIAYVPQHSRREGWVTFESDPAEADELRARPLGYERP